MDEEEVLFLLNKDKAVGVLTAANSLIVFLTITIITVFIPLVYTVTQRSSDVIFLFSVFIIIIAPLVTILIIFYIVKYGEYKSNCLRILIRSLANRIAHQNPNRRLSYDDIARDIEEITNLNYDDIMVELVSIFGPRSPVQPTSPLPS